MNRVSEEQKREYDTWLHGALEWVNRGVPIAVAWIFYREIFGNSDIETVLGQVLVAICGLGVGMVIIAVYLVDVRAEIRRSAGGGNKGK